YDLLAYPHIGLENLGAIWPEIGELDPPIAAQLAVDARYSVYLQRQEADIQALRKDESLTIPRDLDYDRIAGLSTEARQKLAHHRPVTLAQAARCDGVTAAALMLLLAHLKKRPERKSA
ncbi:MAG: tRNA uridine-5-carboxymethylaminomethyl(34) synthesis enzyme MnmG, partial [Methyloligellaceae bacterium]